MSNRRRSSRKALQPRRQQAPRPTAQPSGAKPENASPANSYWALSPVASQHSLRLTAECMADIAVSVTRANELLRTDRLTTRVFQRECRDISTRVRKLVLPNDEVLLKQCFVPTMHPLRMPELTENPSILTQAIGNITIEYTEGEGTVPQKETIPSQHEHETLVGPLYGLRRSKELTYRNRETAQRWGVRGSCQFLCAVSEGHGEPMRGASRRTNPGRPTSKGGS